MEQLNEHVQIIIDEARTDQHSARHKTATNELRRIHQDLPDVITNSAKHLIDEDKTLAPKLSNAAIRELGAFGDERLSNEQLATAIRRTHRNVLMQQAAEHVLGEREGVRTASDFLTLKSNLATRQGHIGPVAIATLERQGIDARRLLNPMPDKSLKAASVGAYDRVEGGNRDRLISALEIQTPGENNAIARQGQIEQLPVMRNPRTQFASVRQRPTFGRRLDHAQMHHAQIAANGQGF